MIRWITMLAAILVSTASLAAEENYRTLSWNDLVPKGGVIDNPITRLSVPQQQDVEVLVSIRNLKKRGGMSDVSEDAEEAMEIRHKLRKQGLNPSALMQAFDRLQSEIERRNKMTVATLDGKMVRIPGYALPLEHAGMGVTEMLLVPYIGACIHVPAPPANQTVYAKLNQTYVAGNLYEPVWITGRMKVKATQKALKLIDGTAGIDTAYMVEVVSIAPYRK